VVLREALDLTKYTNNSELFDEFNEPDKTNYGHKSFVTALFELVKMISYALQRCSIEAKNKVWDVIQRWRDKCDRAPCSETFPWNIWSGLHSSTEELYQNDAGKIWCAHTVQGMP
jgi:hypothetical protein